MAENVKPNEFPNDQKINKVTSESKVIIRQRKQRKIPNLHRKIYMKPVLEYLIPTELFQVLRKNAQSYPGMSSEHNKWVNFLKLLRDIKEIEEMTFYLTTLKRLLYLESYYQDVAMKQFNLKNTRINLAENSPGQFIIRIPSLVENNPSLIKGDIVKVQEVNFKMKYKLNVTYVGENYITVKAPFSFKETYDAGNRYNVYFTLSSWSIRVCHFAIDLIIRHRKLTPLLHPPTRKVCPLPKENLTFSWFNEAVHSNPEQMQAVQKILERTAYPSPYLVFGPPGTGKTATIVEAILQIWNSDTRNKILVCTPSNSAADEITKRLLINVPEYLIYRMTSTSIDGRNVDERLHGCSHIIKNDVYMLPPEEIVKKKIVVTTLITCARLVRMNLQPSHHFSYIFIDEAGQATQPETLIPLCLIKNYDKERIGNFQTQVVLSGDPKQLGPVILTKIGEHLLGKSMLERFMDSFHIYQRDQENEYDPNFITQLVKNYRSHEKILHISNQMFYNNKLIACGGKEIHRGENWSELQNKNFPLIFHALHGVEERDKHSPSVCNRDEVEIVMDYVSKLLEETLGEQRIEQTDIGIITPFRFQGSIIMKALEEKKWNNISVGTVEIFQGQEKNVIIVSTVRSALFQHNGKFNIGFLSHEKRFNVTITRAKFLLIVVGNPKVLQISNCWLNLIKYCQKNEACVGDKFSLSELTEKEMKILTNNRLQAKTEKKNPLSIQLSTKNIRKKK